MKITVKEKNTFSSLSFGDVFKMPQGSAVYLIIKDTNGEPRVCNLTRSSLCLNDVFAENESIEFLDAELIAKERTQP